MKTQLRKPAGERARYSEEYKKEALELWRNSGRSAAKVAAELGIRAPLLYRWARPKRQADQSKAALSAGQSVEQLEAEIRRLRAENAKLLEQREVLKKSLGILSEVPPRGMPESNRCNVNGQCQWGSGNVNGGQSFLSTLFRLDYRNLEEQLSDGKIANVSLPEIKTA